MKTEPQPVTPGDTAAQFYAHPSPVNAVVLAIADAHADEHGTPEYFAKLREAVRILNSHADLLSALKEALTTMEGLSDQQAIPDDWWQPIAAQARAAIAAAEGKAKP